MPRKKLEFAEFVRWMRTLLLAAVGLLVCAVLTLKVTMGAPSTDSAKLSELAEARRTIRQLQQQLQAQHRRLAQPPDAGPSSAAASALVSPAKQRWEATPTNLKLNAILAERANARGEAMLALANDVMMCSNRKSCWWSGGNIFETFLKSLQRVKVTNVVVITLDDATHQFCTSFGSVGCLRLDMPVPKAQQGSRGANMISTLKYDLLRQALLMGFAILVVDLDLLFLKDPFEHLYRDADVEASTDGFSAAWAGGQMQAH